MELPEGARLSDSEDDGRPQTDPHRALNIDLEEYDFFFNYYGLGSHLVVM